MSAKTRTQRLVRAAPGDSSAAASAQPATLAATDLLDYDSPEVEAFVARALGPDRPTAPRKIAVALYYAVRDGIFYEVYGTDISQAGLRASAVAEGHRGFCLHKTLLFAAATRATGIPSRVVGAPVRNHLSSVNLQQLVGGEVFLHWYNEVWLDGAWRKATPIFNKMLCRLYGLPPLEFDGRTDSLHHADTGGRSMEFVGAPQRFETPAYADILGLVRRMHPRMVTESGIVPGQARLIDEAPAGAGEPDGARTAPGHGGVD